jgi:uronate dehydrogenase
MSHLGTSSIQSRAVIRMRPSVAVTGACGRIGRVLVEHLAAGGYPLTLIDLPGAGLEQLEPHGNTKPLDLAQPPPADLFDAVDVVVHLAADADPNAPWERLLSANIQASHHVVSAALTAGCRRVILASSVHAVLASDRRPVSPEGPVAPADLYGVTKCFCEALAYWCAHSHPISAAAVRIGSYQTVEASRQPDAGWMADTFIAQPDLIDLLGRAINAEYGFAILHAAAPGRDVLLDTQPTEDLLGWRAAHRFPDR